MFFFLNLENAYGKLEETRGSWKMRAVLILLLIRKDMVNTRAWTIGLDW